MASVRSILVGVDLSGPGTLVGEELSDAAETVVSRVIRLAEMADAEITFCSVLIIKPPATEDLIEDSAETLLISDAEQVLQKLVERAAERGVTAKARVLTGRSWEELVREVMRSNPDLLVIGSHHRSAAKRMIFGSTVVKVLRKCPAPVWVVHPDGGDPNRRTVIVADDFSEVGEHALHLAVAAAQFMNARLVVVHAVEFPLDRRLFRTGTPEEEIAAYRQRVKQDAEEELRDRLAGTDHRTLTAGVVVDIVAGPPDTVIEDAIEEYEANLLVMGTVARGGIGGLLLGNTAERLLTRIPCSLLALKPDDFKSPVTL